MDWSPYFPAFVDHDAAIDLDQDKTKPLTKPVTVADIGCGFGGLLLALAPMLSDELILGLEIRTQVTEYVHDRITALRSQHQPPVGHRKIVFPSYTVRDGTYIPTHVTSSTEPLECSEEYVIYSKENVLDHELQSTEKTIMRVVNSEIIPSFKSPRSSRTWLTNLTPPQISELDCLPSIQSLAPNTVSSSTFDRQYYSCATLLPTLTSPPTPYANISVLRANTMKFLSNFFPRHSLRLIFLCFPDPHFKARKHKARIVSSTLCAEYAYVLRPGGCVYTITDVEELAGWMKERFREFGGGLFEEVEVPGEGMEQEWGRENGLGEKRDVAMLVRSIREETEEGKKVTRNGGRKFVSVWRRGKDPQWPNEV